MKKHYLLELELNSQAVDHKSDALTITPPSHSVLPGHVTYIGVSAGAAGREEAG